MSNQLNLRDSILTWGKRTYLMGILNVTPDSFSDGGEFKHLEMAIKHAQQMEREGVDIIDIGGQSTRPGAEQITLEEELERVIPVIQKIRQSSQIPLSIDTTRSTVAATAIEMGADLVNDISGGIFDDQMLTTVAKFGVPIILMHLKGTPKTMQKLTYYEDLIAEIKEFFQIQILKAQEAGIPLSHIILDPGIGFAKNYDQNLELLRKLGEFKTLGCPILVGASRKSFIGHILDQPDPKQRVWGTAAACCVAIAEGCDILRVHDLAAMRDVSRVADAIWRQKE